MTGPVKALFYDVFGTLTDWRSGVAREAEESKRKQIEANGIAAFQQTVSKGISDSYLRWQGINATLALAQSSNAKIVIIGSGKDGLPIILGNVDSPVAGAGLTPGGGPAPPAGARTTFFPISCQKRARSFLRA